MLKHASVRPRYDQLAPPLPSPLSLSREREAKRDAQRAAFDGLFNPKRCVATAPKQTGASQIGQRHAAKEVVDLTDEGSWEMEDGGTRSESQPTKAWFALSALTGRLHAFGDSSAPIAEGLRASAPLLTVLEDEPDQLPDVLAAPATRAAAQQWAREWLALTPAQRGQLHNVPLRVPLLSSAVAVGHGARPAGADSRRPCSRNLLPMHV